MSTGHVGRSPACGAGEVFTFLTPSLSSDALPARYGARWRVRRLRVTHPLPWPPARSARTPAAFQGHPRPGIGDWCWPSGGFLRRYWTRCPEVEGLANWIGSLEA